MTAELIFHEFEEKSKEINLRRFLLDFLSMKFDGYKVVLKEIAYSLENATYELSELKNFDQEELAAIYKKYKRYSSIYDKLNDRYYAKSYFEDAELKRLFTSISRNLHKIENTSYKYLIKSITTEPTPGYIKDGIAKLSQEAMGARLTVK